MPEQMLPLPGAPSASWARFRAQLGALFQGADPKVCVAFWLFGRLFCVDPPTVLCL